MKKKLEDDNIPNISYKVYHFQMSEEKQIALAMLEEELGIDLLTLFKALKEGVWLKDKNGNCRYAKVTLISRFKDAFGCSQEEIKVLGFCLLEQEYGEDLHFQDYGKTWALNKGGLE